MTGEEFIEACMEGKISRVCEGVCPLCGKAFKSHIARTSCEDCAEEAKMLAGRASNRKFAARVKDMKGDRIYDNKRGITTREIFVTRYDEGFREADFSCGF